MRAHSVETRFSNLIRDGMHYSCYLICNQIVRNRIPLQLITTEKEYNGWNADTPGPLTHRSSFILNSTFQQVNLFKLKHNKGEKLTRERFQSSEGARKFVLIREAPTVAAF